MLQLVVEQVIRPLVKLSEHGRPVLTENEIKNIFACIEEVLRVNEAFLADLEVVAEDKSFTGLGDAFAKHVREKRLFGVESGVEGYGFDMGLI